MVCASNFTLWFWMDSILYAVMHLSPDTSWLSPKRAMIQEVDSLQRGLSFNIQTSPSLSVLVQPANQAITARKSESPTRSANSDGVRHDSVRRADSESLANGPRKPLSIILTSQTTTQDTLQSVPSMNGSNNDSSAGSLSMSVAGNGLAFPKVVNGGLSSEHTNPPQVGYAPLSLPNNLRTSTSVQGGVCEEPSSVSWQIRARIYIYCLHLGIYRTFSRNRGHLHWLRTRQRRLRHWHWMLLSSPKVLPGHCQEDNVQVSCPSSE